jgi:hypothetical protein
VPQGTNKNLFKLGKLTVLVAEITKKPKKSKQTDYLFIYETPAQCSCQVRKSGTVALMVALQGP